MLRKRRPTFVAVTYSSDLTASTMASASILAAWSSSAGLPEPGILETASLTMVGAWSPTPTKGIQHSVAEAALEPVVFDDDQLAAAVLGGAVQGLFVYRLDGVGVNQTDGDAFRL